MVRPGDVITVRDSEKLRTLYKGLQVDAAGAGSLDWLDVDAGGLMIMFLWETCECIQEEKVKFFRIYRG